MINPYELLGVTINSSISELKRKYYMLCLLVHPDKGGSAEDMIQVHKAYKFVEKELDEQEKRDHVSVESLEEDFKSFCSIQENSIPTFSDIYEDAFDLPKFNTYFIEKVNKETICGGCCQEGYESFMDHDKIPKDKEYNDKPDGKVSIEFFISPYKTHVERFVGAPCALDYTNKDPKHFTRASEEKLHDFTITTDKGLHMADYYEAMQSLDTNNTVETLQTFRSLKELESERNTNVIPMKEYVWGIDGLLDPNRKRINGFAMLN